MMGFIPSIQGRSTPLVIYMLNVCERMRAKLVIGNFGMSDDQERAHMAMWAMWSAPLIMSNDLRSVKRSSKRLLLNKNVIRISQDAMGVHARIVFEVRRLRFCTF